MTGYFVMEYLEGHTLSDRPARGPMPLEQTLRYGIEIADALDLRHRPSLARCIHSWDRICIERQIPS